MARLLLLLLLLTGFSIKLSEGIVWNKKTFSEQTGSDSGDTFTDEDADLSLWDIPSFKGFQLTRQNDSAVSNYISPHFFANIRKCPKWILHRQLKLGFTV